MEILNSLKENKNLCIALGFFDGVHLAHQTLLKKTVSLAKQNNLKSAVLTFLNSPYSVINNVEPVYITPFDKKAELIENLGIDYLYVLDFNEFKNIKANDYINEILLKYFTPKFVVTGFNHTFGKNKEGNSNLLTARKEFTYISLNPIVSNDILVSSTNIKKLITEGDFYLAEKLLKRSFSIKGVVVKGAQIARQLGRNTANIIWDKNIVKPPYGVYFGAAAALGDKFPALINFGVRPTIDKELKETLEVHLMNFDGDLYNKIVEVEFYKKMRDEKKFNSMEELKQQIETDYAEAQLISHFYFPMKKL